MGPASFDLILSSETIYSAEAMPHLIALIRALLKPPNGIALIAAKRLYFGCSGSVHQFLSLVNSYGTPSPASPGALFSFGARDRESETASSTSSSSDAASDAGGLALRLRAEVAKVFEDGQSTIREIVRVSFVQPVAKKVA